LIGTDRERTITLPPLPVHVFTTAFAAVAPTSAKSFSR
jgi:hypothetical protein